MHIVLVTLLLMLTYYHDLDVTSIPMLMSVLLLTPTVVAAGECQVWEAPSAPRLALPVQGPCRLEQGTLTCNNGLFSVRMLRDENGFI